MTHFVVNIISHSDKAAPNRCRKAHVILCDELFSVPLPCAAKSAAGILLDPFEIAVIDELGQF
jgi:hypothetical protein